MCIAAWFLFATNRLVILTMSFKCALKIITSGFYLISTCIFIKCVLYIRLNGFL